MQIGDQVKILKPTDRGLQHLEGKIGVVIAKDPALKIAVDEYTVYCWPREVEPIRNKE